MRSRSGKKAVCIHGHEVSCKECAKMVQRILDEEFEDEEEDFEDEDEDVDEDL